MTSDDLPLFTRWVKMPEVARWWREEAAMSYEETRQKMDPRVLGGESVRPYIFSINGEAAGYIQTYPVQADPDAVALFRVANANAVDIFIGEEKWLHQGLGAKVLRQFIEEQVFSDPAVSTCMIDPEAENLIAVRAYEKAGFRRLRDEVSKSDGLTYTVMRLDR